MAPPGKSKAIIAYITFVGMIIAYFMNREDKHEFATWHIKNMCGLVIWLIVAQVSHKYINVLLGDILWLTSFIAWLLCLILALMNKKTGIPFLSEKFQTWFTFLD